MGKVRPFIFVILIGIFSCSNHEIRDIHDIIEEVRTDYAPDARTAVFDIRILPDKPTKIIGETSLPEAKEQLLDRLNDADIKFQDQIQVLPDTSNIDYVHGIINVSVANLRSSPKHSAELVTQALLGTPVFILKESQGWLLVQTPDRYIAWTNQGSLVTLNENEYSRWKRAEKIIYLDTYGFSTDQSGQKVSDLVTGNVLVVEQENDRSWMIRYPDDRMAIIKKGEAEKLNFWFDNLSITDSNIVHAAKELMGVPYLWGGTSTKGLDCSGFTKTVYLNNGFILPRDASQQAHVGELVDSIRNFSKLRVGDLLFFGTKNQDGSKRVVHVGLWLGDNTFIHASGDVHISSMDSLSDNFDEYNYNRYLQSNRIIGDESSLPVSIRDIY